MGLLFPEFPWSIILPFRKASKGGSRRRTPEILHETDGRGPTYILIVLLVNPCNEKLLSNVRETT